MAKREGDDVKNQVVELEDRQALQLETAKLAAWRKGATAGVAARAGMRAAVERFDAVVRVNRKLRGE